jgi:hypothetical protein
MDPLMVSLKSIQDVYMLDTKTMTNENQIQKIKTAMSDIHVAFTEIIYFLRAGGLLPST